MLAQRRRRRYAVRYTNVDVLASVAGRSWGRHIPAALALLALTALLIALGRPERTVAAPQRQGTVMMVTDTSGSMDATDVSPEPAQRAAQAAARALAKKLPEQFRLGLVSFNNVAEQLVAPTTDRSQVYAAIDGLKVHGSTAMGDGLELGLRSARTPDHATPTAALRRLPAVMVLLSDGKSERGAEPVDVADRAKKLKVPIYTIALGTQSGTLEPRRARDPGAARQRDAARRRRDDRRPLLRRAERGPAGDDLREPRHALLDAQGEAGGHGRLRRRRARAAAGRRDPLAAAHGEDPVSAVRRRRAAPRPAPASRSPRPSARPTAPGPARSRRPSCARSTSPCCGGWRASCRAST